MTSNRKRTKMNDNRSYLLSDIRVNKIFCYREKYHVLLSNLLQKLPDKTLTAISFLKS